MKFDVADLRDLRDTNAFLRSLCAQIRATFGKCAWSYQPHKEGETQTIFLGLMDVGAERTISVAMKCRTRSIVSSIHFGELFDEDVHPESDLGRRLASAITKALASRSDPKEVILRTSVEALRGVLAPYRGDWFAVVPSGPRQMELSLRVHGFDEEDARAEFLLRLPLVLDVMAVETNHLYWPSSEKRQALVAAMQAAGSPGEGNEAAEDGDPPEWNTFSLDDDWIDEYPVIGSYAQMSRQARDLIDRLVSPTETSNTDRDFARACHHFHVGREQDALVYDRTIMLPARRLEDGTISLPLEEDTRLTLAAEFSRRAEELATVLYMSAIEVASSIGTPAPAKCDHCGQEQYKISSRVVDYVVRRTPDGGKDYLRSVFKSHYAKRSKYLHAGTVLVDRTYTGTTIPLLDPSSDSGATQRTSVLLTNMRQWAGFLLRQHLRELADPQPTPSAA
jgi:hypothetical protein